MNTHAIPSPPQVRNGTDFDDLEPGDFALYRVRGSCAAPPYYPGQPFIVRVTGGRIYTSTLSIVRMGYTLELVMVQVLPTDQGLVCRLHRHSPEMEDVDIPLGDDGRLATAGDDVVAHVAYEIKEYFVPSQWPPARPG